MNKKVYMLLGGILVLIVITVSFIFYLSNKNKTLQQSQNSTNQTPASGSGSNSGSNNNSAGNANNGSNNGSASATSDSESSNPASGSNAALIQVTNDKTVDPSISYDGKAVWYFTPDGHLYKENLSSGLKQEKILPALLQTSAVIWPASGNDLIIETSSSGAKSFNYYQSSSGNFISYPPQIKELGFMPDGRSIAYNWVDSKGSVLGISNPDLTGYQTVISLPDKDDVLKVSPTSANELFAYDPGNPQNGKLYYIQIDKKTITTIQTGESNQVLWAPDGQHFLYYKLDPQNTSDHQLWLGNAATRSGQALGIDVPLNKIAFSSDSSSIYFALPASGSGDSIWKMNLQDLSKTQVYDSGSKNISATDLFLAPDASSLYFLNSDGFLYGISLAAAQNSAQNANSK